MSNSSWQENLRQVLKQQVETRRIKSLDLRIAVVGIGNELSGDDAAGVLVARGLRARGLDAASSSFLVIDAGLAPENFGGVLRRFGPHLVIFVDAAEIYLPAGSIRWIDWRETTGLSASTHSLPVSMFSSFISAEIGCEVGLLGIQPEITGLEQPVSAATQQAVEDIIEFILILATRMLPPA